MHWIRTSRVTTCLLLLLISFVLRAQSQEAAPGFIVTYVEAAPAKAAALAADLKAYAGQIESEAGKPTVTVLSEIGRPNRMAVVERWPDLSSQAYVQAESVLAGKVQADALAPIDRHVNHPQTPAVTHAADKAFCVLMHVDVSPDHSAEATKILQSLADTVLAAPGALGYTFGVKDKHTNHFAIYEIWTSRAAYEAYTATGAAVDFRRRFGPFIASPFDDRFYSVLGR